MKKYPKIINYQTIQIRVEVKNKDVEDCKQFYIKQKCEILEEEKASEDTTYIDMMYHK